MNSIKHYNIYKHRCLGNGSYSSVYLGRNTKDNELVAIKMINIKKKDNVIVERLIDEINIMKKIKKSTC